MTKDKQIDEMAKVLREAPTGGVKEDFTIVTMGERFTDYFIRIIAAHLVSQGYRKASDVAEDIVRMLRAAGINEWRYPIVADIKKKYTEGEGI